jgi:hypothetical protein
MTPEEQRVAIAQACGWQLRSCKRHGCDTWHSPDGICADGNAESCVPDYLNDLNLMHEAEKIILKTGDWDRYYHLLRDLAGSAIHATAGQKAESFLRTMELWKKEEKS